MTATMASAPAPTWLAVDDGVDLLGLSGAAYGELCHLYDGVWDADVDPVTLELCRLRLATLLRSPLDLAAREPHALAAGLDEETIAALPEWPTSPRFSAAQRAALAFTEQFVMDAHGFEDGDVDGLLEHLSPPQLATLTIAVAVFDALARVRLMLTLPEGGSRLPTHMVHVAVTTGR